MSENSKYFKTAETATALDPMEGVHMRIVSGLDGENLMMVYTTIDPGCAVPSHTHPYEQMAMVCSGMAKMIIGDQEKIVESGDFCHFPSDVPHSAECVSEEPFKILDIFYPVREDLIEAVKNK